MKLREFIAKTIREHLNEEGQNGNLNDKFWAWFGNSKVVDSSGNPMICYHGTNGDFNSFDSNFFSKNEPSGDYIGAGFYFTALKSTASKYGKSNIKSVYLKIKTPLIINDYDSFKQLMIDIFGYDETYPRIPKYFTLKKDSPITIFETIKKLGYDGLIDNLYNQYAVIEPNQIKSIENDGSWDSSDNNIYS